MDLERGCKMPSTQSIKPAKSPKLSAMEQRIHDAISNAKISVATPPGPPNTPPWDSEKAVQEAVDNLNRKVLMGL
jgi:hypothetical protein